MSEDLAAMGHPLSDDEYYAIILGSLPPIYEPFISALNATATMMRMILASDNLMQAFSDRFEWRSLTKGVKKEENVAFSAIEGGAKKEQKKKKGNCHNWGKLGHYQHECWEEGGGKEGQKPKWKGKGKDGKQDGKSKDKPKGGDSAATAKTKTEDAAWMALSLSDSEDDTSEISFSGTDVSLEDLLEVDKELRESMNETGKGVSVGRAREEENPVHMSGYGIDSSISSKLNRSQLLQPISEHLTLREKGTCILKSQVEMATQGSCSEMCCIPLSWG